MIEAPSEPGVLDDERLSDLGLLVETHAKLTRLVGAELELRCGLPLSWFDVLIRLARSPDHRMTMTELARRVALTSGGVTRLVDRVAEAGFVERVHCPSDRRSIYVVLTPSGERKLQEAAHVHLDSLQAHFVTPLSDTDRVHLRTALRKLLGSGEPVCGGAEPKYDALSGA